MIDNRQWVYIVMEWPTDAFHSVWSTEEKAKAAMQELTGSYKILAVPVDATSEVWFA